MPDYFVFGGCLRSELTFPELTPAQGRAPNWILRMGTLAHNEDAEVLSDTELSPTSRIRVTAGAGWFRYSHSRTGSFEVFADGRRILFEPADHGDLDGARADFIFAICVFPDTFAFDQLDRLDAEFEQESEATDLLFT